MEYKITKVEQRSEWQSKHGGTFIDYAITLEGHDGWVKLTQKLDSKPPVVGQTLAGNIEKDAKGFDKFKKDYGGQYGGQYGSQSKPPYQLSTKDSEGAAWGNALNVSVLALQHKIKPEDLLEYAQTLYDHRPGAAPAPSTAQEASSDVVPTAEDLDKEIDLSDIPF